MDCSLPGSSIHGIFQARVLEWVSHSLKNLPAMQETLVQFLGQEDHWRKDRLPTPVFLGFACGSAGNESACNAGRLGWGDPLEKEKATHSSILAWKSPWIVHGVAKSQTQPSDYHFHKAIFYQLIALIGKYSRRIKSTHHFYLNLSRSFHLHSPM